MGHGVIITEGQTWKHHDWPVRHQCQILTLLVGPALGMQLGWQCKMQQWSWQSQPTPCRALAHWNCEECLNTQLTYYTLVHVFTHTNRNISTNDNRWVLYRWTDLQSLMCLLCPHTRAQSWLCWSSLVLSCMYVVLLKRGHWLFAYPAPRCAIGCKCLKASCVDVRHSVFISKLEPPNHLWCPPHEQNAVNVI